MFTTRTETDVHDHLAVLFIVATLAGLVASTLFANDVGDQLTEPPGLLPPLHNASPMPASSTGDETAEALWQILEEHASGRTQDAVETWQRIALPQDSEVWRSLGLGVAYLHAGDLEASRAKLEIALKLQPENAAIHYFTGLLRMEQALQSNEYSNAIRVTSTRLANYGDDPHGFYASKPKIHYELAAIDALELAIQYAPELDYHVYLLPVRWVIHASHPSAQIVEPPRCVELLDALGADNLTGKSHGILASIYLDHGQADKAEHHTDEALATGSRVPHGYREVGEVYEQQGRHADASRAFTKAMKQGDGRAKPPAKAIENFRKTVEDLLAS